MAMGGTDEACAVLLRLDRQPGPPFTPGTGGPPEPRVGERFTTAGGRELGRIISVDRRTQLTGTIMGAFMSYVLVPGDHCTTRLLLKVVMQTARWKAPALSVGDLIMARRQLLNLKQLTERHACQDMAAD
jgi:hypothetical protein